MASNSYSFADINCTIVGPGGAFGLGNGAGAAEEGITISQTGDKNTMQTGADGSGQHSLHVAKSGTITVRVLKTSPVNAKLMALYNFQTASSSTHGQNIIALSDSSRGDLITCRQVAFKKVPDIVSAKEAGVNEWTFDAIYVDYLLGA